MLWAKISQSEVMLPSTASNHGKHRRTRLKTFLRMVGEHGPQSISVTCFVQGQVFDREERTPVNSSATITCSRVLVSISINRYQVIE